MREESFHENPEAAVIDGYADGAKVVGSAAMIMILVFASFIFSPDPTTKSFGFALALGVLIDACVIRMTVVPATMHIYGRSAWWLPRWLTISSQPARPPARRTETSVTTRRTPGASWSPERASLVRSCKARTPTTRTEAARMGTITTTDGTEIFFKDWGSGQPVVFSHGWPLSGDNWDTQMISSCCAATASSRTTAGATDARRRPTAVTIWIITPMTWRR